METFQIVRQLDPACWRAFVDQHPQGNIFHTPEMAAAFNRARGHRATLWAAVARDGEVLALLTPVQITLFGGPLRPLTSRSVAYGSVLAAPGSRGCAALRQLLPAYKRATQGRVLFTELRNLYDLGATNPVLVEHGFTHEAHLNFLIDLDRPLPELWKGLRANARRNVKRGQASAVQIEEVRETAGLEAAYDVLKGVYQRINVPLPDISLFQAGLEILAPLGMLKILATRLGDMTIGVLCLLFYKDVAYYWYTGTLREYAAHRVGDLLVWHSLEMSQQQGCRVFDFGGGGRPDEEYGVRDFKAKFGGALVNFGRNTCVHGPLRLKVSQAGYQLMRRFL